MLIQHLTISLFLNFEQEKNRTKEASLIQLKAGTQAFLVFLIFYSILWIMIFLNGFVNSAVFNILLLVIIVLLTIFGAHQIHVEKIPQKMHLR